MADDTDTIEEEFAAPDADAGPAEGEAVEPPGGSGVDQVAGERTAREAPPDPLRDRLLVPLLLPLGAMAAIALYVLNISRVFLAGAGAAAVVTGMVVTVAILVGAAAISASPRLRSSTLTLTVAGLLVLVVSAGLITLGPSEGEGEGEAGGYREPAGKPTASLRVVAQPGTGLAFDRSEYQTPGGILEIDYVQGTGTHTLVFEEPQFAGFKLKVPPSDKRKVKISEGEYTIYCDIPGHRQGGMEATLVVTPGGEAPAEGAPPTTTGPADDGS